MAINLHTKYYNQIASIFTHSSFFAGRATAEYDFTGVKTIQIPSIVTQPLVDYSRSGTSRYGTPTDLQDTLQELTMTQDKAFAIIIDKGDNSEQQMMKNAGKVMKQQIEEQVTPTLDKYAVEQWVANCGKVLAYGAAVSKSNIIAMLCDIEAHMQDNFVPESDRWCFVKNTHIGYIRQAPEFTGSDGVVKEMLVRGYVGKFGTLNIVGMPASYFPDGVEHLAFYSKAVLHPVKIRDAKIHQDPPGISGHLLEGRFNYDAFVIGAKGQAVIAVVANGKKTATPTATKGATTTELASTTNSGDVVIYYTLDGSDPRYSTTRKLYDSTAKITNPAAGTVIRAVADNLEDGYYRSDELVHVCA